MSAVFPSSLLGLIQVMILKYLLVPTVVRFPNSLRDNIQVLCQRITLHGMSVKSLKIIQQDTLAMFYKITLRLTQVMLPRIMLPRIQGWMLINSQALMLVKILLNLQVNTLERYYSNLLVHILVMTSNHIRLSILDLFSKYLRVITLAKQ